MMEFRDGAAPVGGREAGRLGAADAPPSASSLFPRASLVSPQTNNHVPCAPLVMFFAAQSCFPPSSHLDDEVHR